MAIPSSLQLSPSLGLCWNTDHSKQRMRIKGRGRLHLLCAGPSSCVLFQSKELSSFQLIDNAYRPLCTVPSKANAFKCHSLLQSGQPGELQVMRAAASALSRSYKVLQSSPLIVNLVPAVGIIIFAIWGLGPLMRQTRNLLLNKSDNSWKKSRTYYITSSYLQPLLLWTGATLICRSLDPIVLPTEASQVVKQRLLNFIRSLSTVLAFAYCLSSVVQQAQKFFMETNESSDGRNMGFQFAGKAIYSAVWIAAFSLFMELLGFSTQKWLTAGGLGTVLLTLAGREIFTNFLSSAMIHATRPFVVNEWIQTKIEGYEVSGTVEHVGWWSPTILRGEDREAVHIPNHKFTVSVVRNLSQKTHWRIKTHLAISHLDVNKINNIVADMRKVLAKNPQVEQQRLHRRVFLDNINPENQALLILVSCFVKTSHHEEYLCVKEAILLDLLRVISHHRARLATPIRTLQKVYSDADLDNVPFPDSAYTNPERASNRPLLMIEPPRRINGEDKKNQSRSGRGAGDRDAKDTIRLKTDTKEGAEVGITEAADPKEKDLKIVATDNGTKKHAKTAMTSVPDAKVDESTIAKKRSEVSNRSTSNSETITSAFDMSSQNHKKPMENVESEGLVTSSPGSVGGISTESHSKQEEKKSVGPPSKPRHALEENIVLDVALGGSKRTLPIEEDLDSPSTTAETKELATSQSGNGHPTTEKERKDR